jgi:hypothetical protein
MQRNGEKHVDFRKEESIVLFTKNLNYLYDANILPHCQNQLLKKTANNIFQINYFSFSFNFN